MAATRPAAGRRREETAAARLRDHGWTVIPPGGQPVVPELVDSTAAREILGGISQQRLSELAARGDFPVPVATFAGRRVWIRSQIEAYGRRERKPGRPRSVA